MSLGASWFFFPIVLTVLSFGCGLLLEEVAGVRLPGALTVGAGLAVMIVVADLTTQLEVTADLAPLTVVVVAAAGLWRARGRRHEWKLDRWALAAAAATFAVFAAPTLLSGEATFAYLKTQDTAFWAAFTTQVMEHGHNLPAIGADSSALDKLLDGYLGAGYPVGSFLPLGVGRPLVGQDLAWLIQPYMAFLGAMLALPLYVLAGRAIEAPPARALAAFVGSQAALLFGYSLWGGIKEMVTAVLLALIAALLIPLLRGSGDVRRVVPIAVVAAATMSALSVGAAIWLLPLLLPALVLVVRLRGREEATNEALTFAVVAAALSLPAIARAAAFVPEAGDVLTRQTALGALVHSLNPLQAFGIWPSGDFRVDPDNLGVAYVLIAVAAIAAALGVAAAWQRRAWELLVFIGGTVAGCLVLLAFGSPWTDAKALAVISPVLVFAALLGALFHLGRGRRLAAVAVAVVAGGVLWSNALAYREVDLAPRDRFAELERIGDMISSGDPVFTTEPEYWSTVHFIPGAGGITKLPDLDSFEITGVVSYKALVVRRGPTTSRPPSVFRLAWRGRYYELWRQRPNPRPLRAHLPIGTGQPADVARCPRVMRLARAARPGDALVTVPRTAPTIVNLAATLHPRDWNGENPALLYPGREGSAVTRLKISEAGRQTFWLGGSFRGGLALYVDGKRLEKARGELNAYQNNDFLMMGEADLRAGVHTIALRYDGGDLRPGSHGDAVSFQKHERDPFPIGPMWITRDPDPPPLTVVPPEKARSLCGRYLDWIELVAGSSGQ